jgi:hypothetical protein
MGNEMPTPTIFKEYEHRSGKRLIAAVRANSREAVDAAVEFTRHEFTKPLNSSTANASDYETMQQRMEQYLLGPKDVGDGIIFKKGPLELATELRSTEAAAAILDHLNRLGVHVPPAHLIGTASSISSNSVAVPDLKDRGVDSATVGHVNAERSAAAKERLKAFQASRQQATAGSKAPP